jgi:SAM-dependent methyltransferase
MREFYAPLADAVREVSGDGQSRLLEIGCGTGVTMQYLSGLGQVTGLDFSGRALSLADVQPLIQGDALSLPFADGSFDAAYTRGLFMYLDGGQIAGAFREAKRVAGTLILGEPVKRDGEIIDVAELESTVERVKPGYRIYVHPYVKLIRELSGEVQRVEYHGSSVFMVVEWNC